MIHIGIKDWFRKEQRNQVFAEVPPLQRDKKNDQPIEVKITQNLENLKRNYFTQSKDSATFFSPEETWARLKQNNNYAALLEKDLANKQPEVFRKKMMAHCRGVISLAEYEYYWIMIDKEAMGKIDNEAIVEIIGESLAIRKSIFQLCMTNQIKNPLLNERAFEEIIGRLSYRHYQLDNSLFIEKQPVTAAENNEKEERRTFQEIEGEMKESLKDENSHSVSSIEEGSLKKMNLLVENIGIQFATENNVKEEWKACSEIAARHSFMKDEKRSHRSPIATDNSQESRKDERIGARVFQKKFFSQLVHNKKMKEKNTYQKKVQKARNWYIYSR